MEDPEPENLRDILAYLTATLDQVRAGIPDQASDSDRELVNAFEQFVAASRNLLKYLPE